LPHAVIASAAGLRGRRTSAKEGGTRDKEPAMSIDRVVKEAVESGALPGVVAMAATRDGVIYQGAHGARTVGTEDPVTLATTFRLHSMTKAVTAVAAMQLVEQGRLTLDAPLSALLPDLGQRPVLTGFDEAGQPVLVPARTPITLRHLLTHTAGFSYDMWNAATLRWQKATGTPGSGSGKRASLLQPLAFEPGTRWQYSIAIDWVGLAVEAASGQSLEDYCRRHILGPLGMNDTTFTQSDEQRARRITMHKRQPDGAIAPIILDRPEVNEYLNGGGGLFGTVPDYLAFTRCLLGGGAPLVRPETFALMSANAMGDIRVEKLVAAMPALVGDVEFWPGMDKTWGLSFLINTKETPEGRSAGSLAWAGLSNLYYWVDLKKGVTGVFASQMLPFYDARAVDAFRAFERAVYDAL